MECNMLNERLFGECSSYVIYKALILAYAVVYYTATGNTTLTRCIDFNIHRLLVLVILL